jgi:DNA-binding response OmpR family regulator
MAEQAHAPNVVPAGRFGARVSRVFHRPFTGSQQPGAEGSEECGGMERVPSLELRPEEGMAVAGDVVVPLSSREVSLLTALAKRENRVVRREDLYRLVWGQPLRPGDRSIDVYVHKLRAKLELAVPHAHFIHTHVGFGYRFSPELSHAFHNQATRP